MGEGNRVDFALLFGALTLPAKKTLTAMQAVPHACQQFIDVIDSSFEFACKSHMAGRTLQVLGVT